ncbi:hypothetical protein ACFE04_013851 [Oxalis oulophora]
MYSERQDSIDRQFQGLSVSKRLVRNASIKLRNKNILTSGRADGEEDDTKRVSLKCLSLYSRGGGCKVGADNTGDECGGDPSRRRSSSSIEEGKGGYRPICGNQETGLNCFSYGVKDKFWKKNNRNYFEFDDSDRNSRLHVFLPDDILEMCLVRLPLTSLMNARLVCKKWKSLTTTRRFLQIRREWSYLNPWLFLFGAVKDGYCSGEIHVLDISQQQWHRIDAQILRGRFMFSVASMQEDIYIVGGCSSLTNFGRVDRSTFKTHKGVLVFSPLTKSWRRASSMKHARSMPILGISEVSSDFSTTQSHQNRRYIRSRTGVSDVYEDPHRLSLRRQQMNSFDESESSLNRRSFKFTKQKNDTKCSRRFVLIAVGGLGSWDEPLDSGEIYDSVSNKWTEIQKLPIGFGIICSGVVCNRIFYVYSENDKLAGYDIEKGIWISVQTSPFPPRVHEYYPKLVSCDGRLFMLSVSWCEGDGEIGRRNKAVRKLWELDLIYLTWNEVSIHPDAPMDWNASFVADKNLIFGIEMFKIFGQVLDFLTVCNVSDVKTNWSHVSRNHMTHELDATSCMTKTLAAVNGGTVGYL